MIYIPSSHTHHNRGNASVYNSLYFKVFVNEIFSSADFKELNVETRESKSTLLRL